MSKSPCLLEVCLSRCTQVKKCETLELKFPHSEDAGKASGMDDDRYKYTVGQRGIEKGVAFISSGTEKGRWWREWCADSCSR